MASAAVDADDPIDDSPAPAPELDPALVEELRKLLDQPAWQVDVAWSVIAVDAREPSRAWRHLFVPKSVQPAPTPTIVTASAALSTDADSHWRGLWDGSAAGFDEAERTAISALLDRWRGEPGGVGSNATILHARWTVRDGVSPSDDALQALERMADGTDTQHLPTRCAAAEAWCRGLLQQMDASGAEEVLHPAGWLLERPGLPDDLRGTLWRTLAVRIPPDRLPGLSRALADGKQQSPRRAAMEACILFASWNTRLDSAVTPWPDALTSTRLDGDPMLRQLFARWAALSKHEDAVHWLRNLTRDVDPLVQEQAIHCLGRAGIEPARDTLRQLCRNETGRRRAFAVAALGSWGVDEVRLYLSDAAPEVRVAAAKSLSRHPGEAAQRLLYQLFTDDSLEVQTAAVTAATDWPHEFAIPVWLEAIRSGPLLIRRKAQSALQAAVDAGVHFPLDGSFAEREQAVRTWAAAHGRLMEPVAPPVSATSEDSEAAQHTSRVNSLVEAYLEAAAHSAPTSDLWDSLQAICQPEDVAAIERALERRTDAAADHIARELLPSFSPLYASLAQLDERDVSRRRPAARQLAQSAVEQPLSPFLLERLHRRLLREQDQLVWQSCMDAVSREGHPAAAQIALVALHSTWPDVRRLGLDYIAKHPSSESAVWLLPLLRDPQRSVRLTAIAAAGRCGNPVVVDGLPASGETPAQPGLRPLLMDSDAELRWAALVVMAVYRDESACQELIRQSFDTSAAIREQAVRAMGQAGQPRFVEPLLKMLWTEPAMTVKLAILSSLEALVPVENQPRSPTGLAAPPSIDDKIRSWTAWWAAARVSR